MTCDISEERTLNLNKIMIQQKRKIALVDINNINCPTHPNVSSKLSNVKFNFFTTKQVQNCSPWTRKL